MSLKASLIGPVPATTARVARAAFPRGNVYLTLREDLGVIFRDDDFADLYSDRGQPRLSPWRLALVTVLQFRENLSDRQAAEAVRARIDWKYLLGLELTDAGFDPSVLSEFRARLSETRDLEAAKEFFAQASAVVRKAPERVTTDGHAAYPRAIRETLGKEVLHRCSPYLNSRLEQDHRAIKQRYYPMPGFGGIESAARFCQGFEEVRQWFRARQRMNQAVSFAAKRRLFMERFAALQVMMVAA